jgi:hypothetical protein
MIEVKYFGTLVRSLIKEVLEAQFNCGESLRVQDLL